MISKTTTIENTILSSGNDILFPTSTTVDAVFLIKPSAMLLKDVILGGNMFSIKLNINYNPIYISCLINFVYKFTLVRKTQGTTIVRLHYDDIKNEYIEICDYEHQCKISKCIKAISNKIKVEGDLLKTLQHQKSYLLQNLFI